MKMKDRLVINGNKPLNGRVKLSGSKNGALPIIAASLLVKNGKTILRNVPDISDIHTMAEILRRLGSKIEFDTLTHVMTIDAKNLTTDEACRELAPFIRASFYVAGPLLARLNSAKVPLPGGCSIGSRPVGYIVDALKELSVTAVEDIDLVTLTSKDGLTGARIVLDPKYCSPGATFNAVMAATLAKGKTVVENASPDPEVESFCEFLAQCGAKIKGIGTKTLEIDGVDELNGTTYDIISDRIEAGTYLIAGVATKGDVEVYPLAFEHISSLTDIMTEMGVKITLTDNGVRATWVKEIKSSTVYTAPYPGFPTDLQPPLVVLMTLAGGVSKLNEAIYNGRLGYIRDLRRMGARVSINNDNSGVTIEGVHSLAGKLIEGTDMRAGAALAIAALVADGESEVLGMRYIERGYEDIAGKFSSLGGNIELV